MIALATSARAKEVLVSRVGERVDYIESRRACPVGGTSGEAANPQGLPKCGHRDDLSREVRVWRRVASDQRDLFALSGEFMGHLPRDILNAAGAGNEAFNHDRDAQVLVLEWSGGGYPAQASGANLEAGGEVDEKQDE